MIRCRILLAAEVMLLIVILAWALATPVSLTRGRDEINYLNLSPIPIQSGQTLRQAVPVLKEYFSGVSIPYRVRGAATVALRIELRSADGDLLAASIRHLRRNDELRFEAITVTPRNVPGAELTVTRPDGPGEVYLFVSPTFGGRPGLLQYPEFTLSVRTLYGETRPAIFKAPVLLERVGSTAPPWFPQPLPGVLMGLLLVLSIVVVTLVSRPYPRTQDPFL